jgi:hypothetical protein
MTNWLGCQLPTRVVPLHAYFLSFVFQINVLLVLKSFGVATAFSCSILKPG